MTSAVGIEQLRALWRRCALGAGVLALLVLGGAPVVAQAQAGQSAASQAIDADLVKPNQPGSLPTPVPAYPSPPASTPYPAQNMASPAPNAPYPVQGTGAPVPPPANGSTYHQDDLIGAAEGVFGKGAHGLASLIKDILHKQGEPNAYITGREASGAFAVGLRYGSGTLYHKVEGQKAVYWTGPSIGFDAGGSAGNTFVLVYNLYNTDDLYRRFPAGEGQAYFIGGFHVSYMRRGDVVLIPVRMGVGLRLGINGGYMKFSRKQNWFPL